MDQGAVSRALAGKGRAIGLSDERVRLICETARTLGYRPNASARAVRAGRFGNVALVLSAHPGHSYLPQRALAGICEALAERDLHLTMAQLPDEKLTDAGFVPRILREYSCDGMLIDYTDNIPAQMIELIEQIHQPAVWLNRKHDHDCVYPDDLAMGRQATRRLLAAGHRRIAYVDWGAGWKQLDQAHYSQRDRQAGYEEAMREAGLTCRIVRRDDSDVHTTPAELMGALDELLAGPQAPTGVLTYSPKHARRAGAAAQRRGLRIPADLSLVTIVGVGLPELDDGRRVTCVREPEREYGVAAAEALLERVANPTEPVAARAIAPTTYVEGETIAPPAREAE